MRCKCCYYYQQEVIQRSRLIYIYKMTQFSESFGKFNRPALIVIFEKLIMQSRFRNHLAWFISHRCYINFSLAQLARSYGLPKPKVLLLFAITQSSSVTLVCLLPLKQTVVFLVLCLPTVDVLN